MHKNGQAAVNNSTLLETRISKTLICAREPLSASKKTSSHSDHFGNAVGYLRKTWGKELQRSSLM